MSGYVLIAYVRQSEVVPLRNLRLIRGISLFRPPDDPTNRGYSLYVADNYKENSLGIGLKELQLTSLHGEPIIIIIIIILFAHMVHTYNVIHTYKHTYRYTANIQYRYTANIQYRLRN